MRIAVIGSGIAGLSSALLAKTNGHEVHLFEQNSYFGGHSNTIDFKEKEKSFPVDTGFLVHNKKTYPNLIKLFNYLKVETLESEMTLAIRHDEDNLEWGGTNLLTLFAQKKNLVRPQFYKMIQQILKFNRHAEAHLKELLDDPNLSLGDFLNRHSYSEELKNWYLIPMTAAIWSTPADKVLEFPALTFFQFCINHNLLQVNDRPVWRTVKGGSREYVNKILQQLEHKYLNCQITQMRRSPLGVNFICSGTEYFFERVILACHADQALKLLTDASESEVEILSSFKFQKNLAVVHTDPNLLPKRKSLWSAWNYLSSNDSQKVSVSYLINKLQPLPSTSPITVTLNPSREVVKNLTFSKIDYEHPLFDANTIAAQKKMDSIQGLLNTYYVGAWQGYGFHEDGLNSSLRVAGLQNWRVPW